MATGTLRPVTLVAVGAQVSGRLTALRVAVGQNLTKDDLIAETDELNQKNALKTANALLSGVQAQLEEKRATLVYARAAMERSAIIMESKLDFARRQ